MSLIDVSKYDEFFYAFDELGYQIMEQEPTDNEIIETLEDIVDEFITIAPSEDNDNSLDPVAGVDTTAKDIVKMGWKRWGPQTISYLMNYYDDELIGNFDAKPRDFEKAAIEGLANGVYRWETEDRDREPMEGVDEEFLKNLEGVLKEWQSQSETP